MTVIAWDGRILASDKQVTMNGTKFSTTKLNYLGNGEYAAATGNRNDCLAMMEWYKDGANRDKFPQLGKGDDSYSLLLVIRNDLSSVFYENSPFAVNVEDKIIAFGCGRDLALGAMAAGANAFEAVKIACKFDIHCGVGCDWVNIANRGIIRCSDV